MIAEEIQNLLYDAVKIYNKYIGRDYLIIARTTNTEKVYHCGASSKDAGSKVCAINEFSIPKLIHPVIEVMLQNPDKIL